MTRVSKAGVGTFTVSSELRQDGPSSHVEINGPFEVISFVDVRRGSFCLSSSYAAAVHRERPFCVYLPPFSILQVQTTDAVATQTAFLWPPRREAPAGPALVLEWDPADSVERPRASLAAAGAEVVVLSGMRRDRSVATRLKTAIDASYTSGARLADLCHEQRTPPAVASRQFRAAFGLSPVVYRNRMRTVDAIVRLSDGEAVSRATAAAGFQDLSRVYRNFRAFACAPPGVFRHRPSKNA